MNKSDKLDLDLDLAFLIIVSGVDGSGRTTLSEKLSEKYGIDTLSISKFKEEAYDRYSFLNLKEKNLLSELAELKFKSELLLKLSSGLPVIVEHSFDWLWEEYFNYIAVEYNYKRIIINCDSMDFEEVWQNIIDNSKSKTRHVSHDSIRYCGGIRIFKDKSLYTDKHYNTVKHAYENRKYTSLEGD